MLKYIRGDLFGTDLRCIAHGVNCQGVMGSGIAKTIREKYPEAYIEYKAWEADAGLGLGDVIFIESKDKIIFNLCTQRTYGLERKKYVSYDAIEECFRTLNQDEDVRKYGLAIPMIGAGLGGGNWNVIQEIIKISTPHIDVTCYQQ